MGPREPFSATSARFAFARAFDALYEQMALL
uniref:Uncharacterized protein n=1 Tax=Arundo donax TaxID=35708 RepID=A0A0A9ANC2_ARUDO